MTVIYTLSLYDRNLYEIGSKGQLGLIEKCSLNCFHYAAVLTFGKKFRTLDLFIFLRSFISARNEAFQI